MAANNHFNLTGGVTRAPKILDNKDGSKKVLFTIACGAGRFVDGAELTNFIPVEAFIPASFKNAEPYASLAIWASPSSTRPPCTAKWPRALCASSHCPARPSPTTFPSSDYRTASSRPSCKRSSTDWSTAWHKEGARPTGRAPVRNVFATA